MRYSIALNDVWVFEQLPSIGQIEQAAADDVDATLDHAVPK
jgi:hypothetical protein